MRSRPPSMWKLAAAVLLLASATLAGCFDRPTPACAFLCGPAGECPAGYACGGDGRCHLVRDGVPLACPDLLPDAAIRDAQPADAPIDATPDAPLPPDAAPDATSPSDASPDAG